MDDDAQQEPVTSGSNEKRADDEHESARSATAEFRVPENVSLTRPDISIRRPAAEEPAPEGEAPEEATPEAAQEAAEEPAPAPAPESGGAGPTRVEALPVLPPQPSQNAPAQFPAVRSSGQWTVPW
ncbi:hypothetical protein E1264_30040, partial [Actinomadura sp. KC216]